MSPYQASQGGYDLWMAAFLLGATQQVPLSLLITTLNGRPASVEPPPTWTSSNAEILTVTADAGGLTATAVATGVVGLATITVTADSDLGVGVTLITGTLDFSIVTELDTAAIITIVPGTPVAIPVAGQNSGPLPTPPPASPLAASRAPASRVVGGRVV